MRNVGRYAALAAVVVTGWVQQSAAQFSLGQSQRAADGTVYEVVTVPSGSLLGGVDQFRVMLVAGGVNGIAGGSNSAGSAGACTSATVGADPSIPQTLHPLSETVRTGILTPNDITSISFNPNLGGRLTIGTGGGAVDICRVGSDCSGGATDAATFSMTSSGGGVPAACVVNTESRCVSGSPSPITMSAYAFNVAGSGGVCSGSATSATTVCADTPSDGFSLSGGQVVVFIYNHSLGMSGFSYGASGFGIDTTGDSVCGAANKVVTAATSNPSAPPPIPVDCGDGILSPGEICDDGNTNNGDGCDNNCTLTACGNGITSGSEQCDDGNTDNTDGCTNNCTICGNGVVTPPEDCDDGNRTNGDSCNNDCRVNKPLLPPGPVPAPAMSWAVGLVTALGLALAGRRVLRK